MPNPVPLPDTPDELYTIIGKCLEAWSAVESALTLLFLSLHDVAHEIKRTHLRAAFEAVASLEVRLAMINATVVHDPRNQPIFREKWNAIYNKVSRSANKRAQVAHFGITIHIKKVQPLVAIHKVHPFPTMTNTFSESGPTPLTYDQLCVRQESFRRLAGRIMRASRYVWLVRDNGSIDPELKADPARLLDMTDDLTPRDSGSPSQPSQM